MNGTVLLVLRKDLPLEIAAATVAGLEERGLVVHRVLLGAPAQGGPMKLLHALVGEAEPARLRAALDEHKPDVAVAFDPAAAAALVDERDRRLADGAEPVIETATPVVAVVTELLPAPSWVVNADRYAVLDEEAAVHISEQGADGARVIVTGVIASPGRHETMALTKQACRESFGLPAELPIVLVDARALSMTRLGDIAVQLALFGNRIFVLFDAGSGAEVASWLRREVPRLGLPAKMFGAEAQGDLGDKMWRAADVVVCEAKKEATLAALASGCGLVLVEPEGAEERSEAGAWVERQIARVADRVLLLAATLDPLVKDAAVRQNAVAAAEARGVIDGTGQVAELIERVARARRGVLAETLDAGREKRRAAERAKRDKRAEAERAQGPATGLEDLAAPRDAEVGVGASAGVDPTAIERLLRELARAEKVARAELDGARVELDRWEGRLTLAEAKGDARLAAEARREADRKRARMHEALAELMRLAREKQQLAESPNLAAGSARRAATPDLDARLDELRKDAGKKVRSVEDELEALKRKMRGE